MYRDPHDIRNLCLVAVPMFALAPACNVPRASRPPANPSRVIYYLDGAGGGGLLFNWGRDVRGGLELAGFDGCFEEYSWQTGLGAAADQGMSVAHKRAKAADLAERILQHMDAYPNGSVSVLGLSAGTAVAVYTLEALPIDRPVDNVVLLSSSLSADYDLSSALRRVRNGVYVFTSERDAVLRFLVPVSGTADRRYCGDRVAGLRGFRMPTEERVEVREPHDKLTHIAWRAEFTRSGHYGGHTDVVKPSFVKDYVAPLFRRMELPPRFAEVSPVAAMAEADQEGGPGR